MTKSDARPAKNSPRTEPIIREMPRQAPMGPDLRW